MQAPIVAELRKLGYEDGRNCSIEFRSAERVRGAAPGLAAEIVAAKVDVIIAALPPDILAARDATATIPIVMLYGMVPRELGLIASLARPGSNVTGTLIQGPEAVGKYCQLMKDMPFCTTKWPVEQGALLAYEPDLKAIAARAAAIVHKILKGASPAGLPVEEPTTYELWINVKTAKAIGLPVPKPILLQAARVIN